MKVRVLTSKRGVLAGQVVDMDDASALRWLSSGDGEKVNAKAGQRTVETATANPQGVEAR